MEKFKLILAPMDGVLDVMMREVLTSCNHYYYAESEFVRIVDRPVTAEQLYKKVPELKDENTITTEGSRRAYRIRNPGVCSVSRTEPGNYCPERAAGGKNGGQGNRFEFRMSCQKG